MVKRYELTAGQWDRIKDFLPGKAGDCGVTARDKRVFVDGVLWVLRSGARWSDLPERYGKWKSVHKRFTRWAKAGVWEPVFADLVKDADNAYIMLDSTMVRVHQQAASAKRGASTQALGRSRGGLTSKIHMVADAQGRPLRFILTAGQVHDATQAIDLMKDIPAGAVIADKAYHSDDIREHIASHQAEAVIPPRSNRKNPPEWDKSLYKQSNKIERLFGKLKHFRRFATRYDRRAIYFRSTIAIAAAMIWLQSIVDSA